MNRLDDTLSAEAVQVEYFRLGRSTKAIDEMSGKRVSLTVVICDCDRANSCLMLSNKWPSNTVIIDNLKNI